MRKQLAAVAALCALALPASAQASATITFGGTTTIPTNNDFLTELNALGLVSYATAGASIDLTADHLIRFDFMGSESGNLDQFTAFGSPTVSGLELDSNNFGAPIFMGWSEFLAGPLTGLLFETIGGVGTSATVGDDGFAIFLPEGFQSGGSLDTLYFGFDDQINEIDDNHDDFIVRATLFPPVPEPSTWLLMILGFGAIGLSMRQRKQTQRIRFNFA